MVTNRSNELRSSLGWSTISTLTSKALASVIDRLITVIDIRAGTTRCQELRRPEISCPQLGCSDETCSGVRLQSEGRDLNLFEFQPGIDKLREGNGDVSSDCVHYA